MFRSPGRGHEQSTIHKNHSCKRPNCVGETLRVEVAHPTTRRSRQRCKRVCFRVVHGSEGPRGVGNLLRFQSAKSPLCCTSETGKQLLVLQLARRSERPDSVRQVLRAEVEQPPPRRCRERREQLLA
eukprot:gnl/TRDRNA2_/TRDRNA2_209807_c0_seq1.p2 gnl/TRDRNA2_/TRDRNA2_209807_c0~~gnl/TRDRNA2_/TRDRNA2_209807_c0_seq1.p2  ORF type:complete len:127 (-),score=15.06 gnl/TRDRNA2_/TRDRNA2_209807_c0_seq1:44-424(-)